MQNRRVWCVVCSRDSMTIVIPSGRLSSCCSSGVKSAIKSRTRINICHCGPHKIRVKLRSTSRTVNYTLRNIFHRAGVTMSTSSSTCQISTQSSWNECRSYVKLKSISRRGDSSFRLASRTNSLTKTNETTDSIRPIRRANSTGGNLRQEVGGLLDRLLRAGCLARITLDCDNANSIQTI